MRYIILHGMGRLNRRKFLLAQRQNQRTNTKMFELHKNRQKEIFLYLIYNLGNFLLQDVVMAPGLDARE